MNLKNAFYEHSPDNQLILKIFIWGNVGCVHVPRAAMGCSLGWWGGMSLKPSWDKGPVQHLPSAKGGRGICPTSLPVDPKWSQSHGAQPKAATAPQSRAVPWCDGKWGVQQNIRGWLSAQLSLKTFIWYITPHLSHFNPCYTSSCSLGHCEHVIREKSF